MNFALIITNLLGGGAERAIINIASLLISRQHSVTLILLEQDIAHELDPGIDLHFVNKKTGHGWIGKRLAAWRLKKLWEKLHVTRPFNLTLSTLPYCDEVVWLANLPNAYYRIANTLSAEIDLLKRHSPIKSRRRLNRYRTIYNNQNLISVSQGVADDLRDQIKLNSNIFVIYNPFDLARIQRLSIEKNSSLPDTSYAIHVGRYAPQKRHDLLLSAWKEANLGLELILLTNPNPELQGLIDSNGLTNQVHIVGFQQNPFPWVAKAELLVLCSDHEGMPNVLIEALACGTRVVSTDCPSGPREILNGERSRWLVPMDNSAALAEAISNALKEPRPQPGAGLEIFSSTNVADHYEALASKGS